MMAVFQDSDHLYRVIGGFLKVATRPRTFEDFRKWWGQNPSYYEDGSEVRITNKMGKEVGEAKMSVLFEVSHPWALITIDAKRPKDGENYSVYFGAPPLTPDIRVKTSGDVAHQFCGGNISVPLAIMAGKVKIEGSKRKALKILPRFSQAYALYPRYLELIGEKQLLRALNQK